MCQLATPDFSNPCPPTNLLLLKPSLQTGTCRSKIQRFFGGLKSPAARVHDPPYSSGHPECDLCVTICEHLLPTIF
jgi:hypothetical protein